MGEAVAVQAEHIHGKSGAVEAAGGSAAVYVPHPQILLGGSGDVRTQTAAGSAGVYPQEVGADVTGLPVTGDGVPIVLQGKQVHQVSGIDLGNNAALGGGGAADIDAVTGNNAPGVHQGNAVYGNIVGFYVALLTVQLGQTPVVGHGDNGYLGLIAEGGDDAVIHGGAAAEVDGAAGNHAGLARNRFSGGGGYNAGIGAGRYIGGKEITGGTVMADLVPIAQVLQNFHLCAGVQIGEGGSGSGGFRPEPEGIGVDGAALGGKGGCGQKGGSHNCQNQRFSQ